MDIITTLKGRLGCKINFTLPALLPNKINMTTQGPVTSSEHIQSKRAIPALQGPVTSSENIQSKRAIPALAIIQGVAAIGGMMIKGVNTLVDAKRA